MTGDGDDPGAASTGHLGDATDEPAALRDGHLSFWLEGEKLRGGFTLQRTRIQRDKPQWLLIKRRDEEADALLDGLHPADAPRAARLMKATLTDERFSDPSGSTSASSTASAASRCATGTRRSSCCRATTCP